MLPREPAELEQDFGIRFERGVDGLDSYSLAAISDRSVGQIWFFKHDHGPEGTDIEVDAGIDPSVAMNAIARHLGKLCRDVVWLAAEDGAGA